MTEIQKYLKKYKITSLYHATYRGALDSIEEFGLGAYPVERINAWEGLSKGYIYFAHTPGAAESYAEAADNEKIPPEWFFDIVSLEVRLDDLDLSKLDFDDNNQMEEPFRTFKYKGVIPWSLLSVL